MAPEELCFRVVRPSARAYIHARAEASSARLAVESSFSIQFLARFQQRCAVVIIIDIFKVA